MKVPVTPSFIEKPLGGHFSIEVEFSLMRPIAAVAGYFFFIFVGGALAAPGIFHMLHLLADWSPIFGSLARHSFHRYVDRSFLVLGVVGLWPFLRSIGTCSWAALGWKHCGGLRRTGCLLGMGIGIGFVSLLSAALLSWLMGARVLNTQLAPLSLLRHLINATLAAIAVAMLEETFFRGAIFGALKRSVTTAPAVLLSSGIYALVHFFERPPAPASVEWYTGLVTLGQMFRGFIDLPRLIPGFFSLLAAGAILAIAFHRTGTLHFSAGLHAGWIFWLKSYGFFTRPVPGANEWLWGGAKLIDGWGALVVLLLVLVGILAMPVHDSPCVATEEK